MAIRTLIRTASLAALIAGAGLAPMVPATAADPPHVPVIQVAASEATSRFIPLGIGKSVAIDLPADIKDVLVADPKIANAVIRTSRRVYMIGVAIGQTNIFFFDADGKQIAGFDIAVTRDLNGVRAALKQTMPDSEYPHRRRRRRHHALRQRIERRRIAAGLRSRLKAGRRRRQGRQRHHRARARPGHAQGDGRGSAARRDQAARHRSQRHPPLRHRGRELQHVQPVFRHRPGAEQFRHQQRVQQPQRHVARDGTRRRDPHPGRAQPDRHLRRDRDLHGGRRIPDPQRIVVRHHQVAAGLSGPDRLQEIRRQPGVHADRAVGRPHQPQGDDRGVRPVVGKRHHAAGSGLDPVADRSPRSAPAAPTPRSKFRPAARWRWPA